MDVSNNIYLAGEVDVALGTVQPALGGVDAFVLKLNSSGSVVWTKSFGSASDDIVQGIVCSGLDAIYAAGYTGAPVAPSDQVTEQFGTASTLKLWDGAGDEQSTQGRDAFIVKFSSQ